MNFLTNNLYPRRRKPWTKLENQRLKLLYPKYSDGWLTREFGRTAPAILTQANILGLHKDVSKGYQPPLSDWRKWTGKETVFLLKHHKTMTFSDIAAAMGRSCNSVAAKTVRLGLKKAKFWTPEEDGRLRQIYRQRSLEELSKIFKRAPDTVFTRARKLEIPKRARPWSKKEIIYLTKNYHLMTSDQLAEHLKHSAATIRHKAHKLGLKSGLYWTEKETQYLKRWHHKKNFAEIAESLGRSPSAVQEYAVSLGLYRIYWTKQETDKLIRLYGKVTVVEIARRLGRTYGSVHSILYAVGLKQKRSHSQSSSVVTTST